MEPGFSFQVSQRGTVLEPYFLMKWPDSKQVPVLLLGIGSGLVVVMVRNPRYPRSLNRRVQIAL